MRGYNFSFQTCSHSSARGGGKWRWHPLNDGIEPDNVLWFWPCKSRNEKASFLQNSEECIFCHLETEGFITVSLELKLFAKHFLTGVQMGLEREIAISLVPTAVLA